MANCISKYKKALKKNLRCTHNTKKQLLKKFEITWSTFLEDNPTPSMDDLCTAFGSPKEMASVLMEEVTPEEIVRYRRRKFFLWGIFGCVLALVLVWGVLVVIEGCEIISEGVSVVDEAIVDDEATVDDEVIADDEIIVDDEIVVEDEIIIED